MIKAEITVVCPLYTEDTVVHGRLLDASVRPMVDTTVRLVTEAGKPLDLPTAKTDASGYYAIILAPNVEAKLESMKVSIAVGEVGTGMQPKAAPTLTLAPGAKILAEVTLTRARGGHAARKAAVEHRNRHESLCAAGEGNIKARWTSRTVHRARGAQRPLPGQ